MVKLAYQYDVDPVSLLLFRVLFSLPFYLGIWFYHKREWSSKSLNRKEWIGTIGIGICGYYLASYFDFKGLTFITASLERLILFTYPTIVLLLSRVFLKKKISVIQIISILITYAGIVIIFMDRNGITSGTTDELFFGTVFVGLSAFFYASYMVISSAVVSGLGSIRLTTYSMIISCLCVSIHFFLTTNTDLFSFQPEVYLYSIAMALFATVIPSFMIVEGIKRMGAPNVSIIGTIGPVSTILLSIIFLGEMLTLIQFGGALVIISGVAIISWSRSR
jgi:drug/metabolite transporter (DMT)-like permease